MNLSVIIPTYKRPAGLQRNLESLITSKVNCFEVVIGDDGGDQETIDVCTIFSQKLPIKYLPPNGKGSLATNITRLLQAVAGDWILFIHDDDYIVGDHTSYPESFADHYDFFFSDHWISDDAGVIDTKKTDENSANYGRLDLREGLQKSGFDLVIKHNVCLDGFYVRTSSVKNIYPDKSFGQVADYFWMYQLLTSGIRIGYSKERTFAYTLSSDGLTAQGGHLNEDSVTGYNFLKKSETDNSRIRLFENKISLNTWYAVNACLRRGEKRKAWKLLKSIRFFYRHSLKQQLLLPLQFFWLLLPKRH